jgi:hypothetical protein
MSQYAFYLKKKQVSPSARFIFLKKSRRIHNGYELDRVFGIKEKKGIADRLLYYFYLVLDYKKAGFISQPVKRFFRLLGCTVLNENDNYNYQPAMLAPSRGVKFFIGGWHSESYFRDIRDRVLIAFQFNGSGVGPANMAMLEKIKGGTSVSVHIRRGDFLDAQNFQKFGVVCTLNYFLSAIARIGAAVDNPHFFFFTNDHQWVREHFKGDRITVVDINSGADSWKDMFLMSNCRHNICSNGSFSWWSAYLNTYDNKLVIVPRNFIAGRHFEDIYPADWIQLSEY